MLKLRHLAIISSVLLLQGYTPTLLSKDMDRLDYQACRTLVEAGQILSMSELMERVQALTSGRMLDTVLLSRDGKYVYEMEVAGNDGVIRVIYVDATTGSLLTR
jgi:uncharacterized membrane protein YkoI